MIRLFRHLGPFARLIWAILFLVLLQSLAELYLPTIMSDIVDIGVVKGDTGYIWRMGGWMLLVAAGSGIASVAAAYLSARVAVGFGRDLRSRVFTRVESYSLGEFDRLGTSTLITRTTNDITQVQMVLIMLLRMVISAPLMAIGGIIMAVSKDATLSLIFLVVVPILAAAIALIASRAMPLFTAMQAKLDRLNLVVREFLIGIRVIRAFDRIGYEQERFERANRDLTATAIRVNQTLALMMPLMMLMLNLTSVAIVWFGAIRIEGGRMEVGDMMAFLQYAMQIMFSVIMVSMMFVMVPRAQASAVRINEVLETEPEIVDPPEPAETDGRRGHLEFQEVTFRYPGAEEPALHSISFQARPGQVTAIIGGTGAGKSTLLNLIPRFHDVTGGRILVDGVDVRELTQADLRRRIGYIPQKAVLFSGTVAENIRYGKEGGSTEEVHLAADVAQAMEFISGMKEGFHHYVEQGGANLSGGQKQRLSIARALFRRPGIYLFDDSFSALDFKTDARLRSALRRETADATVLIVAQRVSTVMDADQIIVLDEGRMVGIGTHKELLQTCTVYRETVASQLTEEELA